MNVLLFAEDCHCIVPELPERVSTVLLVPLQTEAVPEIVPPTDPGVTVTVATELFAAGQTPLVATAL